ncbi:MAG: polyprenyl synthetase family protein [Candidatus Altiarchaeales archaeon]|nr:polyprenyl synthetase family protein [Candidatus Altiarchaeales archaeon]
MEDTQKYLKGMADKLQPVLLSYFKDEEKAIREIMEYPVKAGGKRVRPIVLLLANEIVGGNPEKAMPAAASVELLHTFTLVHDDMMDHDMERRGKPTVHAVWGDEIGIIAGDTLYSIAFKAMSELKKNGVSDRLVMRSFEELIKANSELHEGQILDMLYSKKECVSEREYLNMIGKKTGALLEASLRIGAILGGGSDKEVGALGEFGWGLGLAFQIKDDILGLTADEKELGKPVGSDICEGKKSLPVLHAIEHASGKDREKLLAILNKKSSCDLVESMRIIKETRSIDYSKKKLESLTSKAKKRLEIFKDCKTKERLLNIADFLIERRF